MRRTLTAGLTLVALGVVEVGIGLGAQERDRDSTVIVPEGAEEVWELDSQRRAAVIAGDLETLDNLAADDMTYAHTDGTVDTKESYLEMLRAGVRYETLDLHDVSIAPYDNTVVISGVADIAVKSPNGPIGFRARFTDVWARQDGRWYFVAWHTTRIPD